MIQLAGALLGAADDLAALLAGQLDGLALGDDDLGVQLRLTQHLLHFLFGTGHILTAGGDQLPGLFQLQRELGADLIQQIQRLIAVDDAFVGAEGGALGLVDHAVEHIQQSLHILFFHIPGSFLSFWQDVSPAFFPIPRRWAPADTFPAAGRSGSSPGPWWS